MQVLPPLIEAANQAGRLFCKFACGMFVQVGILVLVLMLLDFVLRTRCRVSASLRRSPFRRGLPRTTCSVAPPSS